MLIGASVSICTDNRLMSDTTVTKEYMLAVTAFDLTAKTLKDIVIGGFKRSFFPVGAALHILMPADLRAEELRDEAGICAARDQHVRAAGARI